MTNYEAIGNLLNANKFSGNDGCAISLYNTVMYIREDSGITNDGKPIEVSDLWVCHIHQSGEVRASIRLNHINICSEYITIMFKFNDGTCIILDHMHNGEDDMYTGLMYMITYDKSHSYFVKVEHVYMPVSKSLSKNSAHDLLVQSFHNNFMLLLCINTQGNNNLEIVDDSDYYFKTREFFDRVCYNVVVSDIYSKTDECILVNIINGYCTYMKLDPCPKQRDPDNHNIQYRYREIISYTHFPILDNCIFQSLGDNDTHTDVFFALFDTLSKYGIDCDKNISNVKGNYDGAIDDLLLDDGNTTTRIDDLRFYQYDGDVRPQGEIGPLSDRLDMSPLNKSESNRIIESKQKAIHEQPKIRKQEDLINKLPTVLERNICKYLTDISYKVSQSDKAHDNIIGRETEINSIMISLNKMNNGNPLLIGEAGVGKTAIVHELAYRMAHIEEYSNVKIIEFNIGGALSGSKYRGDFEEKVNVTFVNIYKEAKKLNYRVILFIDEIHNIVGAGSSSPDDKTNDMSNLIKPYLTKPDCRVIGATTIKEYNTIISRDLAMARRFDIININEPNISDTINIMKGRVDQFIKHHKVSVSDELLERVVKLTDRYYRNLSFPDKALKLLDKSMALCKINHIESLTEEYIDKAIMIDTNVSISESNISESLADLKNMMATNIIGQNHVISPIISAVKRNKAGISDYHRPIASFLFTGPTGVGKSETCKVLAKGLFGSDKRLIRLDMSEYSDASSLTKIMGSAPGYVGYNDGNKSLLYQVKKDPYSVILLDEIEKAHPIIFKSILQMLDDGIMTDSTGVTIDFSNAIVVMTSNIISKDSGRCIGFDQTINKKSKILNDYFSPEFINRIDEVIEFNSLTKSDAKKIVNLLLTKFSDRVYEEKGIMISYTQTLADHIVDDGYSLEYGARNLKRSILKIVETPVAEMIINHEVHNGDRLKLKYSKKGHVIRFKEREKMVL